MKNKIFYIIFCVIISILFILAVMFILKRYYFISNEYTDGGNIKKMKTISQNCVDISRYTLYGTHLNIFGKLSINEEANINYANSTIKFVLVDETGNESNIDFSYEIQDNAISFLTSKNINCGINMEEIKAGNYVFYLKIIDNVTGLSTYYKLKNLTSYGNLEYYTITKNNTNYLINVLWNENGLCITSKQSNLPENVYDIVIDQGHGGQSTGTIHYGYIESEINYDLGIKLKEKLENLGLKVLVTRTSKDQTVGNYNDDGRAVIPNKVKAKYCFSIHNNSSNYPSSRGVEVYAPNFCDLTFAKSIADNIVNIASSSYSINPVGLVESGVYVLKFDEKTIEECKDEAIKDGYEPYKINTDTNMFFMIREVGGICTGAYIDGRDEKTGINPYYNSNMTAESYLLELAYVSNIDDVKNVTENMDKYIDALTKSIKDYIGI